MQKTFQIALVVSAVLIAGAVVDAHLGAKTAITRGTTKLTVAALKPGERVSVDYTQANNMNTATVVKLGTASAPATK